MSYDGHEATAARLEGFIRQHFQVPSDDEQFTRRVHLWEEGYADSIGAVELVAFMEETFAVTIPEAALFDPNFVCIDGMARIIDCLRRSDSGDHAGIGAATSSEHQVSPPHR